MMLEFVDTHCHLNHEDFAADVSDVRDRARAAGVTRFLVIGYDRATCRRAMALTSEEGVYAAVGVHPTSAEEWNGETADELRAFFTSAGDAVAAYGEIGLDYYWDTVPHDRQQTVFAEQIAFAAELSPRLPLIIHNREAQADILATLRNSGTPNPVVMHCFTGDVADARLCLDAGYSLGIGGVSTFKKNASLREAIAYAPLDRLLLETDCPYLAPHPYRGKRNEPRYIPLIAETVATAKGITLEEIAHATTQNALQLFGMK